MRVKWRDRPRNQRWAIVGAFLGMIPAAFAVFEYAYHGTIVDRYLIMVAGLLGGGALGMLLASLTAPKT
jgi:LPS O-antigen subunit length determinant protein (WzzB/FepE family)